MVDGAIVLVDAAEGPMPQTKFVLSKALKLGLRPIVCINKIDKPDERHNEVQRGVRPLRQPRRHRRAARLPDHLRFSQERLDEQSPKVKTTDMTPLFETVLKHVPPPTVEPGPFRMLGTTIGSDPFLGRILTGRVDSGSVKPNQTVKVLARDGEARRTGPRLENSRLPRPRARADRRRQARRHRRDRRPDQSDRRRHVCDPSVTEPMEAQPIDPPTLAMTFRVNDSPLAGTEGDKVTSRVICDRLLREAEGNVALKISRAADKDAFEVAGRGELQLAVLIETMRREGFELGVSRPRS
jgi:GTP-binding protein